MGSLDGVPKVAPPTNEEPLAPRALSERELQIALMSVWLEFYQGTKH